MDSVYELSAEKIVVTVEMLLNHATLIVQDADVVEAALGRFRRRSAPDFSDCLVLEIARLARLMARSACRPFLVYCELFNSLQARAKSIANNQSPKHRETEEGLRIAPCIFCQFIARLVGCLLCIVGAEVTADELSLRGGAIEASELHRRSSTFAFEYRHDLAWPFAFSAGYVNQGHLPNHHRDGVALQLWAGAEVLPRWSVAVGVGPFVYSDTTRLDTTVSPIVLYNVLEQDAHGLGVVYSAAVRWQLDSRWLAELRVEQARTRNSVDTTALTLGLGYELGSAPSAADVGAFEASRNEWTFLAGASVVANNDFRAHGAAATVEYRRMIHPNVEWDVAWMHEGVRQAARRNGVATELWLVRSLIDDRLVLGAGIGPYVAFDFYPDVGLGQFGVPTANRADRSRERLACLVSMTAAYRFDSRWSARLVLHQVIAREPYDAGVIALGLGYRY